VDEYGAEVAEVTVRQYVRARKRPLGWPVGDVFVPQVHEPGAWAEVDWGEGEVELAGARVAVHLFVMRASFSGAVFCRASLVETSMRCRGRAARSEAPEARLGSRESSCNTKPRTARIIADL